MGLIFRNLKDAFRLLFKDKYILLLSMVPIFIGILLYSLLGAWVYGDVLESGRAWIKDSLATGFWGSFLSYVLIGLMTVVLLFIINWTFVLIVSLIASPFNDMISTRVEKVIKGQALPSINESFKQMMKNIFFTIKNELKKILFIIGLTILSFVFSLIPVLSPLSIAVSAILIAITFIDYNWCRHRMTFGECISNYRRSFFSYSLSGAVFLIMMTIPVLNLIALPFAVIYFAVIFSRKER